MIENPEFHQHQDDLREHDKDVAREMAELSEPYWMLKQYFGKDGDPKILAELDEKIHEVEEEARANVGQSRGLDAPVVSSQDDLSRRIEFLESEQAELEMMLKMSRSDQSVREKLSLVNAQLSQLHALQSSEDRSPLSRKRK